MADDFPPIVSDRVKVAWICMMVPAISWLLANLALWLWRVLHG